MPLVLFESSTVVTQLLVICQVVEGGFADLAGIKVGDVITGATGIFDGMSNVLGKGIEEV